MQNNTVVTTSPDLCHGNDIRTNSGKADTRDEEQHLTWRETFIIHA